MIRVLLISDGLSDPAAAQDASERLLRRRISIDVVLIDPSKKGLDLARKVAGEFGSVTAVTSHAEISNAMANAVEAVRSDAAAQEQCGNKCGGGVGSDARGRHKMRPRRRSAFCGASKRACSQCLGIRCCSTFTRKA